MADEHRQHNGVDMDHPSIKAAIHNLHKQGQSKDYIARVVGVPNEVVDKHVASAPKA